MELKRAYVEGGIWDNLEWRNKDIYAPKYIIHMCEVLK